MQEPPKAEEPVNKSAEKKKIQRLTFKPQMLFRENGLESLYKRTQALPLNHPDHAVNLQKVIRCLKSWHFDLMPKYEFEYFLDRCQSFASKKPVQSFMERVRKIHKGEETWDVVQEANPNQHPPEQREPTEQFVPRSLRDPGSIRANSVLFNQRLSVKSGATEELFRRVGEQQKKQPEERKVSNPNQIQDQESEDEELIAMMNKIKNEKAQKTQDKLQTQKQPNKPQQQHFEEQYPENDYVQGQIVLEDNYIPSDFDDD